MDIVQYYKDLLILQYKGKPKAEGTIDVMVRIILQDNILIKMIDAFNPETAVGKQLDILGKWLGLDRFLSETIVEQGDYFSMTSYFNLLDSEVGMTDYANYSTDPGGTLSYDNIGKSQKLNDDDFRFILNMRVIQNSSDYSNKSIDDFLFTFYGLDVIASSDEKLSITYFVKGNLLNQVLIANSKGVLPKPLGIRINGLIKKNKKYFGFTNYSRTTQSSLTTGFTNYTDGFTKEGEMLTNEKVITLNG